MPPVDPKIAALRAKRIALDARREALLDAWRRYQAAEAEYQEALAAAEQG